MIAADGNATFGGSLKKVDEGEYAYGTGFGELQCLLDAECDDPTTIATPGLKNPMTAEIHLVPHSHGPAQTGQTLKAQLSSFLGGCEDLKGFPLNGPDDLWNKEGVCQSTQFSVHQ